MTIAYLVLSFLLTFCGVWIFRRVSAGSSRLLDIPNERSSHSIPVIRGAGIAIIVAVLGTYIAAFGREINVPYIVAASMIAAVSFLDDIFSVPFWIRLAVHFLSAGAFVYSSGHSYVISPLLPGNLGLGSFAPGFTVLFIVWTMNAFNFMDGIDGIAGAQGVGAAFGWMLLGVSSAVWSHANLAAIIVGSCAAFLLFNWPPAKVFMGDVGSTFLGFTFAVFPMIAAPNALSSLPADILLVVILLWLFLFDTVFTRVQLVVNRRNFWKAHREHHYQRVVESGRSHLAVSLFFGGYAVACALALASAPKVGFSPLTALLIAGPAFLLIWPRMSRSA